MAQVEKKKPNYFGIQCWYKSDSHHGKDKHDLRRKLHSNLSITDSDEL